MNRADLPMVAAPFVCAGAWTATLNATFSAEVAD